MSSDSVLEIQARADFSSLFGESQAAASAVEQASTRIKTAMESAASSPQKLEYSMMEARHAAMGLGEDFGVHMPRMVSMFLSHLGGVGPALAMAFTPIAIIGVTKVLIDAGKEVYNLYENVVNLKSEFQALDGIEKTLTTDMIGLSNALISGNVRLTELSSGAIAGSRERVASLGMQITDLGKMVDVNGKQFKDLGTSAKAALREFLVPTQAADFGNTLKNVGMEIERVKKLMLNTEESTTEFKGLQESLRLLSSFYDALALKAQKFGQDLSIANAEAQRAIQAQQEKAQRQAEQAAKEAARVKHDEIIGELNDAEKAAKENTRILEEEVKANREANKSMDQEAEKAAKAVQTAWEKAWEAIVRAQNKANKQTEEANKKLQEQWNHALAPVNRAFDQMIDGLLRGNMRIGEIFRNLGISMLTPILTAFEKAIEAQIVYSLTSGAIGKEHALAGIMRDAYKAAANVYAEVPFPLNIPAAAGVFATVVALGGGMPSAAGGWDVPSTGGFALLHPNEMVLPSNLADNVRSGGGGTHVHFHVNAVDSTGVQDFFDKNGEKFARTLSRHMRRKNSF